MLAVTEERTAVALARTAELWPPAAGRLTCLSREAGRQAAAIRDVMRRYASPAAR